MWQIVLSAVGAVAGGVAGGVLANQNTSRRTKAYRDYADSIRNAAGKYSGQSAYDAISGKSMEEASKQANAYSLQNKENAPLMAGNMNKADPSAAYMTGRNLGGDLEKDRLNSRYSADTASARLNLERANKEADVKQQMGTEGLNAAGGLIDLGKNIISDEDTKNFKQAEVEDALRQIKSIEYKYKPETGLDQDKHVGVTAQSMEGTAFDDTVKENDDGIKMLDKNKLLESVMAGIGAMQKEIDELNGYRRTKNGRRIH